MKRYVIIGDGVAGVAAARAIRKNDPEGSITIFSHEDRPFYSRPLIVDVMTGKRREGEIILLNEAGHRLEGFELRLCINVEAIDGKGPAVLVEGERFPCDSLLIATGARAKMPFGAVEGIFTLRDLADAKAISSYLPKVKRALVYGGGPVGMKAAHALLVKGIPVAIIVTSGQILSRVLDETAAGIVEEAFLRRGAVFYFEREIAEPVIKDGLCAIITDRGEEISGQMAIIAKGVSPDCSIAGGAGIDVDAGILVNEKMETSVPGIYAAGDVVQGPIAGGAERGVFPLWHMAARQGRIAGAAMAGGEDADEGALSSNSMEFFGIRCISMGVLRGDDCEEVVRQEDGAYVRCLFRDNELKGALLLGNIEEAGVMLRAMQKGITGGNRQWLTNRSGGLEKATMEVLF